jgi:hypothetical protein
MKKTHGLTRTHPLYRVWAGMKGRCNNLNHADYSLYGGRGIQLCSRWNDFTLFFEDVIDTYKKGLTLDRVDNKGNYTPENCKWATLSEQANNRRTNVVLSYEGVSYTVTQLARKIGVTPQLLYDRKRLGWSVNEMINGK